MSTYGLAGRSCAVRRFQARSVGLGQLARMLEAAAEIRGAAHLRALAIFAEEAPLALRDTVFDRRDAPPAAIVWYVEADAPREFGKRPPTPHPGSDVIPSPVADWPSVSETIVAGQAIGFAVLAGAESGLACALAPFNGGTLKTALGLPSSATVVALLLIGYPDVVLEPVDPSDGSGFFWNDLATPFPFEALTACP